MTRLGIKPVLLAKRVGFVALLALLWHVLAVAGILPGVAPNSLEILGALGRSLSSASFWSSVGSTTIAAVTGWLISIVLGVVFGLIIGVTPFLDRSTSAIIDFLRPFPVLALMPVVIMILGATVKMQIIMIVLSALWPVLVQTIYGARRQEQAVVDMTKVFRIGTLLKFRKVLLPAALPYIATGIRISASISILVAVGVEVLSVIPGIGRDITLAQENQAWDTAFAYIIFAGIIGWGITAILQIAEKRLLTWNRQSNE